MVIALLALAVAMIAGGLVAVVQGYDIVLLERGWTLVISGSVCATGGTILLGLTMVLFRLGRMQAELVRNRDRIGHAEPAPPPAPALDPLAAVSTGLLAGAGRPSAEPSGEGEEQQLTLPSFMRRSHDEEPEAASPEPERDAGPASPARNDNRGSRLNLPQYLFGGRKGRDKPEAPEPEVTRLDSPTDPDEPDFDFGRIGRESERNDTSDRISNLVFPAVGPQTPPGERDEGPGTGSSMAQPGSSRSEQEGETAPPSGGAEDADLSSDSERTVVGTYNSGDNRYVMFSDGSIEAETPEGLFRFGSLDELKDFIASGGERRSGSTPSP